MRETVNGRQYLTNLESIEMKKIVAVCCVVLLLCLSSFFTVEGLGPMNVRQYFAQDCYNCWHRTGAISSLFLFIEKKEPYFTKFVFYNAS